MSRRAWRWIALGALAVALVGGLWAWQAWRRARRAEDTWFATQRSGVLRVCMDASYPPFENVDEAGRFAGLDVDLAQALAMRWGAQAQFVNIHFDGLYDALLADKCDLILSALPFDRMLTQDVLYSQSYLNAGQVLLACATCDDLTSLDALARRSVGVELGSEGHALVRQFNRAREPDARASLVVAREPGELGAMLRTGQVQMVICDKVQATALMVDVQARQVGAELTDEPLVAAARGDSPLLIAEVNSALETWRQDGILAELQRRWFVQP